MKNKPSAAAAAAAAVATGQQYQAQIDQLCRDAVAAGMPESLAVVAYQATARAFPTFADTIRNHSVAFPPDQRERCLQLAKECFELSIAAMIDSRILHSS